MLEINNIRKSFGGIAAVRGVSFKLGKNEISSIIGSNGAGKTTLFNIITGKISPDEGEILFKGKKISKLKPYQICRQKIGRSFQITNIFPRLSVYENIQIAILSSKRKLKDIYSLSHYHFKNETIELLNSLGLENKKDIPGGLLAHGDQKLLDIGISLANNPEIIFLDEPTAGMSPEETYNTTELIKYLAREREISVLLIEHDMKVVFDMSESIKVMHQGKLIAEGKPEEIRNNQEVQKIYLGENQCASSN